MKKICFFIGNLNNTGGTERVCSIIANELSHIGYDVDIVSITGGTRPFFPLSKNVGTHSLFPLPGRTLYRTPSIIYKLRRHLKKEKINTLIVVESMSVLFTLPAIQGLSIKHICWEHFNFKSDLGKAGRRLARQLAARYCDTVVTLTEQDKQYWLKGTMSKARILSIPNPSPYKPQEYIKNQESKTVLAVGRLTYQKGFDLLIQAWAKVANEKPDWKLIILGEGEDRLKLSSLIEKYQLESKVVLAGKTSDVEEYYKNSDIFCLSSRFEGFPMVLLETLAFGLPVVSFDCDTGPAEILEDTGSFLVEPENTEQLTKYLNTMIESPLLRKEIMVNSIHKSKQYQIDLIISEWVRLLEQLHV